MGYWPVVKKVVKDSDIVLLIADVRLPSLSLNKKLQEMIVFHGKTCVLVFTKIDMVSPAYLNRIKENYKDAFFVSGTQNIGISKLKVHLLIMAKRMKIKSPKIGVVGYPNVGKSAIINVLVKRESAKVSAHAGTTRGIQWIRSNNLLILDSPGVIPFEDDEAALGILGAKNPERLKNIEKVAFELIRMFVNYNKNVLKELYGVEVSENYENILEEIGRKKGFLLKGGIVDERRAAMQILRDWQKGKLRV